MNQVCAQCGAVGFHAPGCGLGQISAPLQQAAQNSAMIQAGVGNLQAEVGGLQADVQAGFGAVRHQLQFANVLAVAAMGVAVQQLGHLSSIDASVGRLVAYQERQAALTQVLFELQQKGAYVTELARTDAFSAGIYGRLFVEGVAGAGISAEAFDKLEYKHEFAAVLGRLRAAWTPFALRPDMAQRAGAFLAAAREAASWQNVQVPDEAQVNATFRNAAEVRAERYRRIPEAAERKQRANRTILGLAVALAVGFVVHIVLIAIRSFLDGGLVDVLTALLVLVETGVVTTGAILYAMSAGGPPSFGPDPDEVERQAFAMKELLERYRAFASRPDGARLVDEVLRAHPALRQQ